MTGRDLIIGCYTNYDWSKVKYWVNSINRSGFDGHKMMIVMNSDKDTVRKIVDAGFTVIAFDMTENGFSYKNAKLPVHVERFFYIWDVLSKVKEDIRYVITTDVKDVVFQRNPSEYLDMVLASQPRNGPIKLLASSESMRYMDESWGNQNLLEAFGGYFHELYKTNLIYNVGVLAGEYEYMKDLCLNIFQMSINRPIPIVDQAVYNYLLWQKPWGDITRKLDSESGWAAQLGTTMDPAKIEQFKPHLTEPSPHMINDMVKTNSGRDYYIVHQWDRVPPLYEMIERKYG